MEPIVIGRVEDPAELDLEPQEITLVGYTLKRQEVTETFRIRPVVATGAALDVIRQTDPNGNVALSPILDYVDKCLLEESDRERFRTFVHRDDVMIHAGALVELYQAMAEFYSGRPTRRPSASASSGSASRRTSRAAARSQGSRSKSSR